MKKKTFADFDEFIEFVESLPEKKVDIPSDISKVYSNRALALQYEKQLEKWRITPYPIYVRSTLGGPLELAASGMSIGGGAVIDISRASRDTILNSGDLHLCFEKGWLEFVQGDVSDVWKQEEVLSEQALNIPVFDSLDECADGIFGGNVDPADTYTKLIIPKAKKKKSGRQIKFSAKKIDRVGDMYGSSDPIEFGEMEINRTDAMFSPTEPFDHTKIPSVNQQRPNTRNASSNKVVKKPDVPPNNGIRFRKQNRSKDGEGSSSFIMEVD